MGKPLDASEHPIYQAAKKSVERQTGGETDSGEFSADFQGKHSKTGLSFLRRNLSMV